MRALATVEAIGQRDRLESASNEFRAVSEEAYFYAGLVLGVTFSAFAVPFMTADAVLCDVGADLVDVDQRRGRQYVPYAHARFLLMFLRRVRASAIALGPSTT